MKRSQLQAFVNCLNEVPPTRHDGTPWTTYEPKDLEQKEASIFKEFDCDLFELFRPIRDPMLVSVELNETRTTLSSSGLMDDLACPICMGICKEVMVVKDCSHRFCAECIQKWLRSGHQLCPQCRMKIPSRRALRHDQIFDAIIERLFPDVEAFEKERNEVMASLGRKMAGNSQPSTGPSIDPPMPMSMTLEPIRSSHRRTLEPAGGDGGRRRRAASLRARDFIRAEARGTSPREAQNESSSRPTSSSRDDQLEIEDPSESDESEHDEDAQDNDVMSDEEEEEDVSEDDKSSGGDRRRRRRGASHVRDSRKLAASYDLPPSPDAAMTIEVFLICQNTNLPPSLLSLARELSKRPLRFGIHQSSRDVGVFLAERLIRDALGPMDPMRLQHELSFVKEGEYWPSIHEIPLPELCRTITESRGPAALRYHLSDRLLSWSTPATHI
eukprot:Gregarina_sp_Pseudo_9__1036@NODE_1670_length_1409_cov_21_566423_g1548_i0_p1_GENE_NODE_1670_length_1409_cov_21_566423_g1548_i0NODE_1670_length_1409_cov_21_566423_g1548_i0_p1_ORF_typecomplete_len456_score104_73zfC3HC4_2/PF13923_6/3_4e12zfC3HC4/PF00097_25/5_8e08zfC3HC4_3/PF13920_6/8_3e08zfRING_2/PF13639_6/1e07zfRING_6/PF14835_6/9_7e08Ubox/PF04564_15/1_9e07ProkRING_4/PF14447_6/2_9e05zfRING_5/PF14634_6/0_0001zfC3HC4_4/PF15227_6/0_00014zfANAPC11/PF12861_7/0_00038zfrbx1/PF12678_7/2_5e03zfrbx1/PF12678_7